MYPGFIYQQGNTNVRLYLLGPSLTMVKSVSNVTLGGVDNIAIPGATITYKIWCSNAGAAGTTRVVIYDHINSNTLYKSNSSTNSGGWTNQFSTNTNPDNSYDSTDYISTEPAASAIKWLRWKKPSMAAGETGRLLFKVIIK